jgi:hypothetical protein
MKAYIAYKKWWIEHRAKDFIPSLYYGDDPETAFRTYVDEMSLFELMETLVDWEEDQTTIEPPPPFIPPTPPYKYDPLPYPQPWPTPFPRPMPNTPPTQPVWPGVRNCSKCGINLDGVMGYVCGDANCPTFMKVTC